MKKVFKIKKGYIWDGDEEVLNFITDSVLDKYGVMSKNFWWEIKKSVKITVIIERLNE